MTVVGAGGKLSDVQAVKLNTRLVHVEDGLNKVENGLLKVENGLNQVIGERDAEGRPSCKNENVCCCVVVLLIILIIGCVHDISNVTELPSTDRAVFLVPVNGSYGLVITEKYVEEVIPGGAADRQGSIAKGDEIISVNGEVVVGTHVSLNGDVAHQTSYELTHEQIIELINKYDFVKLRIRKRKRTNV